MNLKIDQSKVECGGFAWLLGNSSLAVGLHYFRVVKEEGISVADSAATWFLQVLASTVTASIPVAPRLQRNLLAHSQ